MFLSTIVGRLLLDSCWQAWDDRHVSHAYTSDLLSDVMANAQEGQALITIQAHKNTVAVASLFGASCIIICNQRAIPDDMIAAAKAENIPLFVTKMNQYTVSAKVYMLMES